MSDREALPPKYIKRVFDAAKRANSNVLRRRAWADDPFASPVVTLQLCAEIARLNIALEAAKSDGI